MKEFSFNNKLELIKVITYYSIIIVNKTVETSMITKSIDLHQINNQELDCATSHPKNHIGGINWRHPKLISAVLNEDIEQVKDLLQQEESVNCTSNNGGFAGHIFGNYTPIIIAVIKGNKEIVQTLLKANANPLQGSYYNKNALEWANSLGYKEIADLLNEASRVQNKRKTKLFYIVSGCAELLTASVFAFEFIVGLNCRFYGSNYLYPCENLPRSFTLLEIGAMSFGAYKCFSYAIDEFKSAFQESNKNKNN